MVAVQAPVLLALAVVAGAWAFLAQDRLVPGARQIKLEAAAVLVVVRAALVIAALQAQDRAVFMAAGLEEPEMVFLPPILALVAQSV